MEIQQQATSFTRVQEAVPIKYCLYARKSTNQMNNKPFQLISNKGNAGDGKAENMEIADIRRESHSAKDSFKDLYIINY